MASCTVLTATLALLAISASPTFADYLVASRSALLKQEPVRDSEALSHVEQGAVLRLVSPQQQNGYYEATLLSQHQTGWVYRTFVRRYPGQPPGVLTASDPATAGGVGHRFVPGCDLPFAAIASDDREIDKSCGAAGAATVTSHRLQNIAKNNFCAKGNPVAITSETFQALQSTVDSLGISFGTSNSLPADRTVLRDLVTLSNGTRVGEGDAVRYVGFVLKAHYSNVSSGESVNCKLKRQENNDIHIALGATPTTKECASVTAEISPHFRPEDWNPANLVQLDRPVRLTGQLFFDGSHVPCRPGKPASPQRVSVWEVHPVYAIDVCLEESLQACSATNESRWMPLDERLAGEEE